MSDGANDQVSANLPRNAEYAIHRVPALATVTPGAHVRYSCDYKLGRLPEVIGGPSRYRDGVRWYKFRERALLEETRSKDPNWAVPVEKGPLGEFAWDCQWNEPPGRYVVGAEISDGRESTFCFVPQYVEVAGLVVGRSLDDLLAGGVGPSPDEAERAIGKHLANLEAMEKRFPIANPADKRRHEAAVEKWKQYRAALRKLLSPTDGKPRIAVRGMHVETATQARRPLLLFLCHVGDEAVGRAQRKRPRWALVDWTDPTDTRYHGTYEGVGDDAAEAIRAALSDWDWGNRYPAGQLAYELPAHAFGSAQRHELTTNGKSLGDEIVGVFEWVAVGGLVVAGALLLFASVPAVAGGALGTSLFSSTAAATISIGQRWRAGVFDWRQDAFDGLTIIGNLFAGTGTWVRGARVMMSDRGGAAVTRVLFGAQIGTDLVQGVLIGEDGLAEWAALTKDPDLLPEERTRKLLALFAKLAAAGLMTYLSVRGSISELETLTKKPRHVPDEGQARAPADKIADLTKPDHAVDTTKPPKAEGHTKDGTHQTTVSTGLAASPKRVGPEQTEFAAAFPPDERKWKTHSITKTRIELMDYDDFIFSAECTEGTLTMTVTTKNPRTGQRSKHLRASEAYPKMYKHFEQVGNPVERLEGVWVLDNYDAAKKKLDELLAEGIGESQAETEAVMHAITYLKYHRPQGFTKVVYARHVPGWFEFKIERP